MQLSEAKVAVQEQEAIVLRLTNQHEVDILLLRAEFEAKLQD